MAANLKRAFTATLQSRHRESRKQTQHYNRQFKRLFPKAHLRKAAALAREVWAEFHESGVGDVVDAEARAARKAKARRRLNRLLSTALPNFRQWQAVKKARSREGAAFGRQLVTAGPRVHVEWGDVVPTAAPDAQDFVVPFPVSDVHAVDEDQRLSRNESFATPDTGNMMNAFKYYDREDPAAILGLYGLLTRRAASSLVSCGLNYVAPRAGRLQISAVLQNFYSEILYALRDNAWFSWGMVDIRVQLFIAVERGGTTVYMPTTVRTVHRTSDGDDISGSLSGFDETTPYTVYGTTEESFPASATVRILVGCDVHVESELDDMSAHVEAVVRWQLKKMTVGVV